MLLAAPNHCKFFRVMESAVLMPVSEIAGGAGTVGDQG